MPKWEGRDRVELLIRFMRACQAEGLNWDQAMRIAEVVFGKTDDD